MVGQPAIWLITRNRLILPFKPISPKQIRAQWFQDISVKCTTHNIHIIYCVKLNIPFFITGGPVRDQFVLRTTPNHVLIPRKSKWHDNQRRISGTIQMYSENITSFAMLRVQSGNSHPGETRRLLACACGIVDGSRKRYDRLQSAATGQPFMSINSISSWWNC